MVAKDWSNADSKDPDTSSTRRHAIKDHQMKEPVDKTHQHVGFAFEYLIKSRREFNPPKGCSLVGMVLSA
jgi:hypothetical protein